MEVTSIAAKKRTALGKRQINRLREEGMVPAVLYGLDKESESISLDCRELDRHLRKRNRVFEMNLGGAQQPVYLQSLQIDVVTDVPLHVDFLRIDMAKPLVTSVELVTLGVPVGLAKGGTLVRNLTRLKLSSLPSAIPSQIEIKVSGLDVGDELRAKDIELPEGASLAVSGDTVVCHVAT